MGPRLLKGVGWAELLMCLCSWAPGVAKEEGWKVGRAAQLGESDVCGRKRASCLCVVSEISLQSLVISVPRLMFLQAFQSEISV